MSFLQRVLAKADSKLDDASKEYSMEDFDREFRARIRGASSAAGIDVTEERAMRYITVYSCIRVLAETMGALPFHVYRRRRNRDGADRAYDHPVYELIHDLPNDEMTSMTWRETVTGNLALSGNGYSVLTRNGRGQTIDAYPVQWDRVQPYRDLATQKVRYRVYEDGLVVEDLPPERMLHILGFGFDGLMGASPVRMAAEAIGMGIAAMEFSARFYSQGMNVGGVLEHPGELGQEAYENLKRDLEERGAGLANSWRPLILEEGMKFNRIPMPLDEAQFIETRKLNRDEICGLYRVPPHMIGNLERATFSNVEQLSLEFVMYTMLPWITRWEQACNWRLFTKREREEGYYVKFSVAGLMRGDYKSRMEGLAIMRQNGILNADEWRELEEMNPIGGGVGEAYLVNGNMIPVERAMQKAEESPAAASSNGRGSKEVKVV